jgi:hypothetical protein
MKDLLQNGHAFDIGQVLVVQVAAVSDKLALAYSGEGASDDVLCAYV